MRTRRFRYRVLSVWVAAVVAFVAALGFLAHPGYDRQAHTALGKAASAKQMVYVVTKAGSEKYSYNEYGLLSKAEDPLSMPYKITYTYNKKMQIAKFKSASKSPATRKSSGTIAYDKKGRLAEITSNGSHGSNSYRVTYKYNKKDLPSAATFHWHSGNVPATTSKNSFDKKGRLVKADSSRFSYDARGNLKAAGYVTWSNTYKNSRLALRSETGSSSANSTAYKYKKLSVPSKYVSQVKKQQWALLNPEASFVFPPYF